jgi:hypothetical protein
MAVTITRTPWIDDDGTGTSGTVINNAVKTDLYNQIDGALAQVAQLNGGNSFNGNQGFNGIITVAGAGVSAFATQGAGTQGIRIQNGLSGATNVAALSIGNDQDAYLLTLQVQTSGFNPSGAFLPASAVLSSNNGLSINTVVGPIRVYTQNVERARYFPSGGYAFGTIAADPGAQTFQINQRVLSLVCDGTTLGSAIGIQNTNPANSINYLVFMNSVGAATGNIAQTGSASIIYGASSDARLKDDRGRASDLAALRAVVVHDFTWKADGVDDRGVFAQEIVDVFPRAVLQGTDERNDDGALVRPWMADYSKFVADLIVGWQQHDVELAALRAALAALSTVP